MGVIPFERSKARFTFVIACSKEAKARGVQNVMRVPDALALCPDLKLVTQRPDLFRRANSALLNEIKCEIPIDVVKSIDELACQLTTKDAEDPLGLAWRIKQRISNNLGPHITCSIGFAANRLLAKMACKMDKPNGVTIWKPEDMPGPLLAVPLSDISGVGKKMERRLNAAGIWKMGDLLDVQPKHARALWGNVNGERMWYALQGYALKAQPTGRGMYGHGRVLPPSWRKIGRAYEVARLLLIKAARRMRRDGWYTNKIMVWLDLRDGGWVRECTIACANDDHAVLVALTALFDRARKELPTRYEIKSVGVTLLDLTPATGRQLDILLNDDNERQRWEMLTSTIDGLNRKFGKRVVSVGPWTPPPGGYVGGKIAFNRIPSAEDFW